MLLLFFTTLFITLFVSYGTSLNYIQSLDFSSVISQTFLTTRRISQESQLEQHKNREEETIKCWTEKGKWELDNSHEYRLLNKFCSTYPRCLRKYIGLKIFSYRCGAYHSMKNRIYRWTPTSPCARQLQPLDRSRLCALMKGRPLIFSGDSLQASSFYTMFFAITRGNYSADILLNGSLILYEVDSECISLGQPPFTLVLHMSPKLYVQPDYYQYLQQHPDAVVVLNRGAHYNNDTRLRRDVTHLLTETYLKVLSNDSLVIWRTASMGHNLCMNYNAPLLESNWTESMIADAYGRPDYKWKLFPKQSESVISPVIESLRSHFSTPRGSRLIYLDVFPSIRLRPDQHVGPTDCLHYCLPGPIDSWVIFIYNIINLKFSA